jgi:hypothetical protein
MSHLQRHSRTLTQSVGRPYRPPRVVVPAENCARQSIEHQRFPQPHAPVPLYAIEPPDPASGLSVPFEDI